MNIFKQRQKEKQKSRELDDFLLKNGLISVNELRLANGFFSKLDLANSRIVAVGGKLLK
jgi:hypothetical protein